MSRMNGKKTHKQRWMLRLNALSTPKGGLLCVCLCVVCVCCHPAFILDVWLVDVPAGVIQNEGHTGLRFPRLPSAVFIAFMVLARRIQPFLSLVDREVEFCVLTN